MDATLLNSFGMIGVAAALALSAVGSALGTGTAGMAAIGAWKKCYAQGKPATFLLLAFAGAPLSQTIYGMILMFMMQGRVAAGAPYPIMLGAGIFGGIAIGMSAWFQGKAGAAGCHALAETDQGFTNYLAVLGIIETVAIFVMVFLLLLVR